MTLTPAALQLSGLVPFTTVDCPGRLSAVVFCQGCAWRCRYCHNTHLQPFQNGAIPWHRVEAFLQARRGLLDAVVFSGGEPTAQPALSAAVDRVRSLGYEAALHTAGMHPQRFRTLLPRLHWVGLDIKAPLDERYDRVVSRPGAAAAVRESLSLLLASGVAFELRTTVHPLLLTLADREDLCAQLAALGAPHPRWQTFRSLGCKDQELNAASPSSSSC